MSHSHSFPRLYAAASLKQVHDDRLDVRDCGRFPRLYAAASLKRRGRERVVHPGQGFPRLYAAASLKREYVRPEDYEIERFSAALCRGLIEAFVSNVAT